MCYTCEFCNKSFEKVQSLSAHKRHCRSNPNFNEEQYYKVIKTANKKSGQTLHKKYENSKQLYNLNCKKCGAPYQLLLTSLQYNNDNYNHYCSVSCRNSHKLSDSSKKKISNTLKLYNYNKNPDKPLQKNYQNKHKQGKHKQNKTITNRPSRILKTYHCKFCNNMFTVTANWKNRKYCCQDCKDRYYNEIQLPKMGGYREGSGRGKSGWYKGYKCDSSWELAFVIYHLDHNLYIERCKETRSYIFENEEHTYYPDFITDNGIIEIKGYSTPQWEAKIKQNPDINVLYQKDMQIYLDYVIHKYGANYISLYDGSNPKLNISNNKNIWVHKFDDTNKIYYTKVINPQEFDNYINDGWIKGRGKLPDGYTKENIKNKNVFSRL